MELWAFYWGIEAFWFVKCNKTLGTNNFQAIRLKFRPDPFLVTNRKVDGLSDFSAPGSSVLSSRPTPSYELSSPTSVKTLCTSNRIEIAAVFACSPCKIRTAFLMWRERVGFGGGPGVAGFLYCLCLNINVSGECFLFIVLYVCEILEAMACCVDRNW